MGITYKDSGVDIDASNAAKKRIRELARDTFTPGVLSDIGSFGGMFACDFGGIKNPVLVSSTDGVGTKLKVAVMMNRHNTVGADLVNHCVNDILVQGASSLASSIAPGFSMESPFATATCLLACLRLVFTQMDIH